MKVVVMILAGGRSERLLVLTRLRAKTSLPYAGRYRIIDFALSNCVHSNLYNVSILAQYNPVSLIDHIKSGKPWDLDRRIGGVRILQPYTVKDGGVWYRGTADALYQNLDFFDDESIKYVLVLSGDQVYKMDYRPLIEFHRSHNAPITIAATKVMEEDLHRFGVIEVDKRGQVVRFEEKPQIIFDGLASMGIYLFTASFLRENLKHLCGKMGKFDIVYDIVIPLVEQKKVWAYCYNGYWQDIGTVLAYYESQMGLLQEFPVLNLYDNSWKILTKENDMPAVRILSSAQIARSLICNGAIIKGTVIDSIISGGVVVEEGAYISRSIIFEDSFISKGARVEGAIIDKIVKIGENAQIGGGSRGPYNEDFPEDLNFGITLIGKGSSIPDNYVIGKNCLVDIFIREDELPCGGLENGKSVLLKESEIRFRGEHSILRKDLSFFDL
ncbi:MAG: glucose-1-phosphate adenylyltransferase family protein [bacterium]